MKKLLILFMLSQVMAFAKTNPEAPDALLPDATERHAMDGAGAFAPEGGLTRFAGVYQLNEQFRITVSVEDGKLYGLAPGDAEKTEFSPVSGNKFIIKGPETTVEFLEEDGQVQYMLVNMQGGLKLQKVQ